ncbi:MAG: PHP-associated domain-containing protein [Vicinamibacterales bacterium]
MSRRCGTLWGEEAPLKLDTHVHSFHSGQTSIYPLSLIMRESYNTPEGVYRLAKARGMDLVTITDHDQVSGALALADRPDVVVGCEVTGVFPNDRVRVHLNVLGITAAQHGEVERLRRDVRELMPYLRQERIFTSLNHVASGVNGPITAPHVAALLPWVDAIEVNNGSRLPAQNRTARCLAEACGKTMIGGSDAHTRRGIGRTWTEVPGAATREAFMRGLWEGRTVVGGRHGSYFTMASDMLRFAAGFYQERVGNVVRRPLDWRAQAFVFGGVLGLPLVTLPLAAAYVHFVMEERFNRNLLYDLVARPALTGAAVPELAA